LPALELPGQSQSSGDGFDNSPVDLRNVIPNNIPRSNYITYPYNVGSSNVPTTIYPAYSSGSSANFPAINYTYSSGSPSNIPIFNSYYSPGSSSNIPAHQSFVTSGETFEPFGVVNHHPPNETVFRAFAIYDAGWLNSTQLNQLRADGRIAARGQLPGISGDVVLVWDVNRRVPEEDHRRLQDISANDARVIEHLRSENIRLSKANMELINHCNDMLKSGVFKQGDRSIQGSGNVIVHGDIINGSFGG